MTIFSSFPFKYAAHHAKLLPIMILWWLHWLIKWKSSRRSELGLEVNGGDETQCRVDSGGIASSSELIVFSKY
jgi:hypothetical protein